MLSLAVTLDQKTLSLTAMSDLIIIFIILIIIFNLSTQIFIFSNL
jgi:hypothetical protein